MDAGGESTTLNLRLECAGGGFINCGPLRVNDRTEDSYEFIDGPIHVVDFDGVAHTLDGRNGIDADRLEHLRSDLGLLLDHGHGLVFFGDHDFGQIAELEVVRPDFVRVTANLTQINIFGLFIGELGLSSLHAIVSQVDRIESELGALTGHCKVCGSGFSSYYAKPL